MAVVARRPDDDLVEHDLVEHLQPVITQAGGDGLGVAAAPADQVGDPAPAERPQHGPHLDRAGPLGRPGRVVHGLEALSGGR